jgi:UDP-N-acetylmuramoyl-tripeptide--D-alanyl-D-alanine ligase
VHVVTSVALEHLEFMGTIEAIAAAEAEPVRYVATDGAVVVPSDEPLLVPYLPGPSGPRVIRFGPDPDADVRIEEVTVDATTRTAIRLAGGTRVDVSLRLFGAHNARNAAAALAVGEHLGFDPQVMVRALETVDPVGDRSRVHRLGEHLLIADCYNANPGSVDAALRSLARLRDTRPGPLLVAIGDMLELGPRQRELHETVGQLAVVLRLDGLVALGAVAQAAVDAAAQAGVDACFVGDDIEAAADWVSRRLEGAEPGAVLVKASRGMKLERLVERLLAAQPR